MTSVAAFGSLPAGLRDPLIAEHNNIVQNYLERRWTPAGVSAGKFCEIVYTIIDGHGSGSYCAKPTKPTNMLASCRGLEGRTGVPRSFQILIPRLLPALYEVRNNRGIGHAGGDVDPNHMDATLVLAAANWIMAELVRVLHATPSTSDAQAIVDSLAARRMPLVWEEGGVKRVLDAKQSLQDQVLLLASSTVGRALTSDLLSWTGASNRSYFKRLLRALHKKRFIELSEDESQVSVLPPGAARVEELVRTHIAKIPGAK
jgi:hypothetical protein